MYFIIAFQFCHFTVAKQVSLICFPSVIIFFLFIFFVFFLPLHFIPFSFPHLTHYLLLSSLQPFCYKFVHSISVPLHVFSSIVCINSKQLGRHVGRNCSKFPLLLLLLLLPVLLNIFQNKPSCMKCHMNYLKRGAKNCNLYTQDCGCCFI